MNGGRRAGTGRKRGGRNAAQLKIIDIAGTVLQEIDAKEKWKALLNCSDPKVMVNVMEYLHRSRAWPSHTDHSRQSGIARHDSVAMVLHAGMADIGHGESAGESHRHVNGSRRGDPAHGLDWYQNLVQPSKKAVSD
jgi:hypothetical protein